MPIPSATGFVERLRPAGGRRSNKREFIVNTFLRQQGHISADALVDVIHRADARISRATIYRTLPWMVDAEQTVIHVYGRCDGYQSGAPAHAKTIPTEAVFARGRRIFLKLAGDEDDHLARGVDDRGALRRKPAAS